MKFPDQPFAAVYVIYDADVLSCTARLIEEMSPAEHMTAGVSDPVRLAERQAIAARFTQTEGDEQYDYAYLGKESSPPQVRFFPYGAIDADGTMPGDNETDPDDEYCEPETGEGQHRKWVAELTREEWLIFAGMYLIDLDEAGYPADYEETMGAITEYGHLEAVSVDNREGWHGGPHDGEVIDSGFYISFAFAEDPGEDARELAAQVAAMENDGAGLYATGIGT
jgi:hypothetical protein